MQADAPVEFEGSGDFEHARKYFRADADERVSVPTNSSAADAAAAKAEEESLVGVSHGLHAGRCFAFRTRSTSSALWTASWARAPRCRSS